MKLKTKLKLTTLISLYAFSFNSYSAYERHFSPYACIAKTVMSISGSNAEVYLKQIQAEMATTGSVLSTTMNQTMTDLSNVVLTSSNDIQATSIKIDQNNIKQQINMTKMFNDQKYSYELNRLRKEELKKRTVFFEDDTPQEITLIVDALDKNSNLSVREIAVILKENFDDVGGTIPIPFFGAEGVCTEKEINDYACSTPKTITPARKLLKMFSMCNEVKAKAIASKRSNKASNAIVKTSTFKANNAIKTTNSTSALASQLTDQKEISCNVDQYKNKYCGVGITKPEFQEKLVKNEIVQNANINPSNMLNPTSVGEVGTDLVDSNVLAAYTKEALDNSELDSNPLQEEKQIPIVYTYRNSSQLKGSFDYVDNVVGYNLIPNQSTQDIKKIENLEYQSRYKARMSSLNLVNTTLSDSVKIRIGEKLTKKLDEDPMLSNAEFTKESSLGAGELDSLYAEISKPFDDLTLGDNGLESSIKKEMITGSGGEKYWKMEQIKSLKLQQKLLFKQYLSNERAIMLKSAILANEVNSPENTNFLKELRKGTN